MLCRQGCTLFNQMHPYRDPIGQSTENRIERNYRDIGNVRDTPKQSRPRISGNIQHDLILFAIDNSHSVL